MIAPPVAVIAFNRPDYFAPVVDSLARQQGVELGRIALFQDGLVNPHSGKRYGKPEIVDQQVRFFKALFPQGEVFVADSNLGPALNFERAERWAFETCDADTGLFFEDDMVLSPHYIHALMGMLAATEDDPRVAYLGAYGSLLKVPDAPPNSYVPMHTNWAFALKRNSWLKMRPYLDQYLEIVGQADYRDRDIVAIMALRQQWHQAGSYTTQDVLHTVALRLVGGIKICSHARLGRYIGARGLHISPMAYEEAGFGRLPVYLYPLEGFGPVSDRVYEWCCRFMDGFTGVGSMVA